MHSQDRCDKSAENRRDVRVERIKLSDQTHVRENPEGSSRRYQAGDTIQRSEETQNKKIETEKKKRVKTSQPADVEPGAVSDRLLSRRCHPCDGKLGCGDAWVVAVRRSSHIVCLKKQEIVRTMIHALDAKRTCNLREVS